MRHEEMKLCLACGADGLVPYLDLGTQPLANAFHVEKEEVGSAPLGLNYCPACWHSQLTHAVRPEAMFEDYPYVSGTTATLGRYFDQFADRVEADHSPTRSLRILEIGCNDGSLLARLQKRWHRVIGVDPAKNLAAADSRQKVQVIEDYWSERTADYLLSPPGRAPFAPFDVIIAMNVLAHVPDPAEFLWQCRRVLAPGGTLYIQTSQAKMVETGEFDTVYHEHHSFFTASSFAALARRTILQIESIEHVPIHGISYLLRLKGGMRAATASPEDFVVGQQEAAALLYQPALYQDMQRCVDETCAKVWAIVDDYRKRGYRIVGYGAAAKAMTFLNTGGLELECIIDDNPLKVGKLTPGGNIPVVGTFDFGIDERPILWLILAWNFRAEIIDRIKAGPMPIHKDDRYLSYFPEIVLE